MAEQRSDTPEEETKPGEEAEPEETFIAEKKTKERTAEPVALEQVNERLR